MESWGFPFLPKMKGIFSKICVPSGFSFVQESRMNCFIHPFSKQTKQIFFSTFIEFWKILVTKKYFIHEFSNSWTPVRKLGSQFLQERWASLEVKGRMTRLSTTPALPACGSGKRASQEVPWHRHRLTLCLTVFCGKQMLT